jgi:hypothetical protein
VNRAFGFGIGSLLAGIGLYVAMGLLALHVYDGEPRPGWLNALFLVATALVAVGLLAMVNRAVAISRGRR